MDIFKDLSSLRNGRRRKIGGEIFQAAHDFKKIPSVPLFSHAGGGGGKKSLICISLVRTHKGGRGGAEDDAVSRYHTSFNDPNIVCRIHLSQQAGSPPYFVQIFVGYRNHFPKLSEKSTDLVGNSANFGLAKFSIWASENEREKQALLPGKCAGKHTIPPRKLFYAEYIYAAGDEGGRDLNARARVESSSYLREDRASLCGVFLFLLGDEDSSSAADSYQEKTLNFHFFFVVVASRKSNREDGGDCEGY